MAIAVVHCPVEHAEVFRVTDLEGATIRIVCADYDEATGICRLKARTNENGPLGRLLERAQGGTLDTHDLRCVLA
jgi:hypothetical protein